MVGLHFIAFRLTGVWRGSIAIPAALLTLYGTAGIAVIATADADWVPLLSGVASGFTLLIGSIFVTAQEARFRQAACREHADSTRRREPALHGDRQTSTLD